MYINIRRNSLNEIKIIFFKKRVLEISLYLLNVFIVFARYFGIILGGEERLCYVCFFLKLYERLS